MRTWRASQRWNPHVNAIVGMLPPEACRAMARQADERTARGEPLGPLHGLPIAFKDLQEAAGLPFTRGSPIYRDAVGHTDTVVVERMRRAGALPIGKTNVPEFGLGSHTYNAVWGTTRNPYDLTASAGGSSGGAGAALATGMLPIADGSDLGGLAAQPGELQQRGGAAAERGPGADRSRSVSTPRFRRERSDGPVGGRRGPASGRAGRPRRARPRL